MCAGEEIEITRDERGKNMGDGRWRRVGFAGTICTFNHNQRIRSYEKSLFRMQWMGAGAELYWHY
jgi:hypothetical protein